MPVMTDFGKNCYTFAADTLSEGRKPRHAAVLHKQGRTFSPPCDPSQGGPYAKVSSA